MLKPAFSAGILEELGKTAMNKANKQKNSKRSCYFKQFKITA